MSAARARARVYNAAISVIAAAGTVVEAKNPIKAKARDGRMRKMRCRVHEAHVTYPFRLSDYHAQKAMVTRAITRSSFSQQATRPASWAR